jgi:hypothetical protein
MHQEECDARPRDALRMKQAINGVHVDLICFFSDVVSSLLIAPFELNIMSRRTTTSSSHCCVLARKSQRFRIPPRRRGIEPPHTPILPPKDVVDNIRHKERHRREVMHPTLEASVRRPEDKRRNAILAMSAIFPRSLEAMKTYVISGHQKLFKLLIRLPHSHTIIHTQCPQRLNLVMQMSRQRFRKRLNQTLDFCAIKIFRRARLCILVEDVEAGSESTVLLDVVLHEPIDAGDLFDCREELCFLGVVMVVHGFAPALTIDEKVADGGVVVGRDIRGL